MGLKRCERVDRDANRLMGDLTPAPPPAVPGYTLLRRIGKALDFEGRFCEEAMEDLLENKYIATDPPHFSRMEYAEAFLHDCIRIAWTDRELHPREHDWLVGIARANGLAASWVEEAVRGFTRTSAPAEHLEIEGFL